MPVILADPRTGGGIEWEDISQDRWQENTIFFRFEPAYEVRKLVLFAASTAVNGVDDSRQVNV